MPIGRGGSLSPFVVLVCGGREFADSRMVVAVLDELHQQRPITLLLHGACGVDAKRQDWYRLKGADGIADRWARWREVPVVGVPARWTDEGKAAGALRNQRMLDAWQPRMVVAFPGGNGTADMVRRAEAAGVVVYMAPEQVKRG